MIVAVPVPVVIVALDALVRATVKLSGLLTSKRSSPLSWTEMPMVVSPGAKVSVPLVAV